MLLARTIWRLMRKAGWALALLAGPLLASAAALGQARGQQAVPATPTAAPTGQPAPLAPAKLEEALRLLLKADSAATLRARQEGGLESQGLVLDQAITKLGHDFYDEFYSKFEEPMGASSYTIVIGEKPGRSNSNLVLLTVNDAELLELPLPTRADQMQEVVAAAVQTAQGYLQEELNNSRQLESGQRLPPERY